MKRNKIFGVMALALSVLFLFSACTVANVATSGDTTNNNEPTVEESSFKGDAYNFRLVDTQWCNTLHWKIFKVKRFM